MVGAISERSCSEQHMTGTQPDISVDGLSKHQALLHTKTAVCGHRSYFTLRHFGTVRRLLKAFH